MTRSIAAVVSVLALGACAHTRVLEPAPGASLAPGTLNVAQATLAGVTVRVTGDAWDGDPWDLYRRYTPVRVTVENRSGQALILTSEDFALTTARGARYVAVPASKASGVLGLGSQSRASAVRLALWERDGFYPNPFDDPRYYDEEMREDFVERLPSRDMMTRALPIGLVPAGGSAGGFVYFQQLADRPLAVLFEMDLIDAPSGKVRGHLTLPFQVTRS